MDNHNFIKIKGECGYIIIRGMEKEKQNHKVTTKND